MQCEHCDNRLEVIRRCRKVLLKCCGCQREFKIHEVASRLDRDTEEELEKYTTIIYD